MRIRWASLVLAVAVVILPHRASAFCGFYVSGADGALFNNATQVVLMREGTRTVLSMQNNYQGPPKDFAMVVPVPVVLQKENVKTLPREVFTRVEQLAAPRLVEYWEEDPCAKPVADMAVARGGAVMMAPAPMSAPKGDLGVKIEAKFTVGEYQVLILSASDSTGLDTWLRREKYTIPAGAEPILRPYVASGMKFFVAKVDASKVKFDEKGMATLSPLRFHYDAESFNLPIRLGLVNSSGTQDLIVHILAKGQRYEVADYPNVTIPTNFDVEEQAKGQFASFYATLLDGTLSKNPKAIVTEYSWDAQSCDPCPTPALDPSEIATLGGDVLPSGAAPPSTQSRRLPPGASPPFGRFGGMVMGGGYVLTRLHARYGKDAVGEDLVFRAAPPITGGREFNAKAGELEHTAQGAARNNFQARYAVRHPWTGAIACTDPVRGRWGGPPGGVAPTPKAALGTAFAPRNMQLASFVRSAVPDAVVLGSSPPPPAPDVADASAGANATGDAGLADGGAIPPPQPPSRGCGSCNAAPSGGDAPFAAIALLVGLAALRRRRD